MATTPAPAGRIEYVRRPSTSGPRGSLLAGAMSEYGRDPLGAMQRWHRDHGDFVPIRFGPFRAHIAFGPAEIEELLIERAGEVRKSFGTRMLIPLLGHGLLTAEGAAWLRHRRLAAPAFHRERVAGYGTTMVQYADEATTGFVAGDRIDLHAELTALTLRIVARVLFDADVSPRIEQLARLGAEVQDYYYGRFASLRFLVPTWLPTPGNRRLKQAIRDLDAIVYGIIGERDRDEDRGDLLSILLQARDEHGQPLTTRQLRDEVLTLLLAGHETTALALTWAFVLLDRNRAARERLEAELAGVVGDRPPTPADIPNLPYAVAVVNETLRLCPPAYVTGRETLRATTVGGVRLPRRHVVLVGIHATHRDPRYFEEPERFRPERWLDGLEKRLPRGAFIPFGLGPRKCIGASFAMQEATLLLATIGRRRRFELTGAPIGTHPAITLRPAGPVAATVQAGPQPAAAVADAFPERTKPA